MIQLRWKGLHGRIERKMTMRNVSSQQMILMRRSNAGNMLNVWGYWTNADSKQEQSAHISSALVSPDKSLALLRALGTAEDVRDYAIPSAESDMEINEAGFALKGWIVDHSHDPGLDGQDRWAGGISFPPPMPAPYVIDVMGLEADSIATLEKQRKIGRHGIASMGAL